jgi:signal transduction histidine kinase
MARASNHNLSEESLTPLKKPIREGLGLGLAISKAIVEMHAGTIRARSDGPGKGATFVIDLPVRG